MDLILTHAGPDPTASLELVREVTGLGRAEAGGVIAHLPHVLAEGLPENEARAIQSRFEKSGATIELRASSRT